MSVGPRPRDGRVVFMKCLCAGCSGVLVLTLLGGKIFVLKSPKTTSQF